MLNHWDVLNDIWVVFFRELIWFAQYYCTSITELVIRRLRTVRPGGSNTHLALQRGNQMSISPSRTSLIEYHISVSISLSDYLSSLFWLSLLTLSSFICLLSSSLCLSRLTISLSFSLICTITLATFSRTNIAGPLTLCLRVYNGIMHPSLWQYKIVKNPFMMSCLQEIKWLYWYLHSCINFIRDIDNVGLF